MAESTTDNGLATRMCPEIFVPSDLPPDMKKVGSDWWAAFNPKEKRVLDVNLVHTLPHESLVLYSNIFKG